MLFIYPTIFILKRNENHYLQPAVRPQSQKALLLHTHTVTINVTIVTANGALFFLRYELSFVVYLLASFTSLELLTIPSYISFAYYSPVAKAS